MRTITVVEWLTLDGVMQAPARADEDPRGGFTHGGWGGPYGDNVVTETMGKGMGNSELLFGRRTYEDFFSVWPNQSEPNPFTEVLNNTTKHVASNTLSEPLPWIHSHLLRGDARSTVSELKNEDGPDLVVLGSGALVRSLMSRDLVDAYRLAIAPLVLGSGIRLFPDKGPSLPLQVVESVTTPSGVTINTYQRRGR